MAQHYHTEICEQDSKTSLSQSWFEPHPYLGDLLLGVRLGEQWHGQACRAIHGDGLGSLSYKRQAC